MLSNFTGCYLLTLASLGSSFSEELSERVLISAFTVKVPRFANERNISSNDVSDTCKLAVVIFTTIHSI